MTWSVRGAAAASEEYTDDSAQDDFNARHGVCVFVVLRTTILALLCDMHAVSVCECASQSADVKTGTDEEWARALGWLANKHA